MAGGAERNGELIVLTGSGGYLDPDVLASMQKERADIVYGNLEKYGAQMADEMAQGRAALGRRNAARIQAIIDKANSPHA